MREQRNKKQGHDVEALVNERLNPNRSTRIDVLDTPNTIAKMTALRQERPMRYVRAVFIPLPPGPSRTRLGSGYGE